MTLSCHKDKQFVDNFHEYYATVKSTVDANLESAKRNRYVQEAKGLFACAEYSRQFTLTGALQVGDLAELRDAAPFFHLHSTRYIRRGNRVILRGRRYLAAIDPGLSVPQTIQVYCEDLHDSLALLEQLANAPSVDSVRSLAPLLDYAKNSIITLTNAFLFQEKRGRDSFDSSYLRLRSELIGGCRRVTAAFYSSLLGTINAAKDIPILREVWPIVEETVDVMIAEYKSRRLSSREFVRPEASHPLILLAFCALFNDTYRASAVVGLPSGSTELACLLSEAMSLKHEANCPLLLLPYSRHSMRVQYGSTSDGSALQRIYEHCYYRQTLGTQVLLVDDNSSSGATLEAVRAFLATVAPHSHVEVGVAEADLRRSKLDLEDFSKRPFYASQTVFKHSVGILPVAKRLWRKHDLKEVSESFSLAGYYSAAPKPTDDLRDIVKAEISAEAARHPFSRLAAEPEWTGTPRIDSFRDTFLSNFWPVRLSYRGREFPTVEHAYQWSKFDENILGHLSRDTQQEISGTLGAESLALPGVFHSATKPGLVKKLAELLVKRGLQRDNWDDIRVDKMIDLTLRKYCNPDLKAKLLATGQHYLLEGNDWGDVFWGACQEEGRYRGRNMLGLILMNVRNKVREGKL